MSLYRYENIEWSLPFLFNNQQYYSNLFKRSSNIDINLPVKYLYGYIKCHWNGFIPGKEDLITMTDVEEKIDEAKKCNVIPLINFSNYYLEESDLQDKYCNTILDLAIKKGCQFIVSSDLLYKYIKNKYPEAKMVSSWIKALYELETGKETEFYKKIYDDYEMITLFPKYVKNGFREDINKYDDVSKFEIIVNDTCLASCDKYKQHDELISNFQMDRIGYLNPMTYCPKKDLSVKDGISDTLVLSRAELDSFVKEYNIKHLRINGYYQQPILYPELISSYIFETIGNFQHISFMLDDSLYKN